MQLIESTLIRLILKNIVNSWLLNFTEARHCWRKKETDNALLN